MFVLSNAIISLTHGQRYLQFCNHAEDIPYAEVHFLQEKQAYCKTGILVTWQCPEKFSMPSNMPENLFEFY